MEYELTQNNFDELVTNNCGIALVDFWAAWCGPCQMQAPVIEELAEELDDVIIGKVNVDEQPELAVQFDISSIPTLLLFKNGEYYLIPVGISYMDLLIAVHKLFERLAVYFRYTVTVLREIIEEGRGNADDIAIFILNDHRKGHSLEYGLYLAVHIVQRGNIVCYAAGAES